MRIIECCPPISSVFPDFGPDPDFFQEIGLEMVHLHKKVWIWPKMEELTLEIGPLHHEFNDEVVVLKSWKHRECSKKSDKSGPDLVLFRTILVPFDKW